ncbi:D-alanyl-D-alanine carboxypeptidase/D-alanyl-D-alanine-endopeptidase [Candidatus Chrysopegis kryptomonas]|nr:D-alanyl-D-alanine carboxypeptidase/D-alanyl-D-alanine-endopeptidase [Candidatus Chrysopegis kryptomonas]
MGRYLMLLPLLFQFYSCATAQKVIEAKPEPQKEFVYYEDTELNQLRSELDDIFNNPSFSNAYWGVVIQSLETGEYFYRLNEHKSFIPASNMKLFTTAVALLKLGPDFKYRTNLYTDGEIKDGILYGNLFVRGTGDPTISGRFTNGDVIKTFKDWADSLIKLGIKEINGDIIGDDNYFDDQYMGTGWSWDDETYWYSAHISALSFNDNCVDLEIIPGKKIGEPALVKITPETKYVKINNFVTTVHPDSVTQIDFFRAPGTNVINVFGKISLRSKTYKESISVHNPTLYTVTVLKEVLESKGIKVNGNAVDIDDSQLNPDYETMKVLASYESPPLSEIIKVINKRSQNFYAEQVFRTLGKIFGGEGSTQKSVEVIKNTLSQIGIPPDAISIYDGSGLSRLNLVTPFQILTLLNYMYRHEYFSYFYESLPIAGVDGTLETRMRKTKAQGNVRAKTGYVQYARSLSGYVKTKDDEMLAFVMMTNNYLVPTSVANITQDIVCNRLANFSRRK